jgi:hypothetical protein
MIGGIGATLHYAEQSDMVTNEEIRQWCRGKEVR